MPHNSIDSPLVIHKGNILTSGGAGNLAKGQMAIVTNQSVSGGRKALGTADFAGLSKREKLQIRVGRGKLPKGLKSTYASKYETSYFTPESIVSIKAHYPQFTKQSFDQWIVGYDGIDASKALSIPEGKSSVIDILIDGKPIEILTGQKETAIKMHFGREEGQTNQEVVKALVERLKEFKLPRSQKPLSEFVDVDIIDSSNVSIDGIPYSFSTISIADNGDSNDLADIQAQYPSYEVVRTARTKTVSEYTILHPSSVTLADYSLVVNSSYIKGCADCLAGYSEIDGGVVYHVTLEDDGATQVALVDNLPGYVTGTVARVGSVDGKGVYSIVVDNELTDAEKASFIATNAISSTAVIVKIGSVETVCDDQTSTDYTWVASSTCSATVEQYTIQLKDNDCGESRLSELQSAYPNLTIEEGVLTGKANQTVTLTGTSGTANISIEGVNYLATFATSLTVTADNFVTAHATNILNATGAVVTANAGVITINDDAINFPKVTITNETTNLAGTVGVIDYLVTAIVGGCQRVYSTSVTTSLVCDECDDIFLQSFTSEAPKPFELTSWNKVEPTYNEDALMGIRLTGKSFEITPTELTRDQIPFYETSTRIRSVFGGYREMDFENFDPAYTPDEIFNIQRIDRAVDRDSLGNKFFALEETSRAHYLGEIREKNNNFAKANLSEESLIDFKAQYVTYDVSFRDESLSQSAGGRSDITHTAKLVVEFGYHEAIEDVLNKLAVLADVDLVKPTAK